SSINQETPQSLQLINPSFAGKFSVFNLQDIFVKNNIAYIAAGVNGFKIFDITDLNNAIEMDTYQLANGFAHQLNIQGNYAYVAYDVTGLRIIDITNPRNISLAGVYMMGNDNPPITKVAVTVNKAFTVDLKKGEFSWVDISQPTSIFRVYLSMPGSA